jgi:hypothetical protein
MRGFREYITNEGLFSLFGNKKVQIPQGKIRSPNGDIIDEPQRDTAIVDKRTRQLWVFDGHGWRNSASGQEFDGFDPDAPLPNEAPKAVSKAAPARKAAPQQKVYDLDDAEELPPARSSVSHHTPPPIPQRKKQHPLVAQHDAELEDGQTKDWHDMAITDSFTKWWDLVHPPTDVSDAEHNAHAKKIEKIMKDRYGWELFYPNHYRDYPDGWVQVPPGTRYTHGHVTRLMRPGVKDDKGRLIVPARAEVN